MPALSLPAAWTRRIESSVHVAGLIATAWIVLPHSGPDLFRRAIQGWMVGSLALAWALIMILILRLVIRNVSGAEVVPTTFRAAAAGVWFAPAILMPATIPGMTAAAVLVVFATRLMCVWEAPFGRFSEQQSEPPRQIVSVFVAAGLQGTVAMLLLGHRESATALLSITLATFTCVAIAVGAWTESRKPNLPRSVLGLCLTFLLAMVSGHLLGGGGWGVGDGAGSSSTIAFKQDEPVTKIGPEVPKKPEPPPVPPPGATGEVTPDPHAAEIAAPGSFPGVILWPDVKPEVMLVEPYPAGRSGGAPALARPFVIPFGGEYWMFRWPFARPPHSSYFRRGSPAKLAFATTDRSTLEMEALQKLDRSISLTCCSKIEVIVQNADAAAAGIDLELTVIDNELPYKPPLSLGTAHLRSTAASASAPMLETLDYPVPPRPALARFDEFKMIFHRDPKHQDHSSKVAIDRFILVP